MNDNKSSEYWNLTYSSNKGDNPMTIKNSSFITFCSQYFEPHFKGIEFGCGNGRDSLWFSQHIQEYFGLDLSPEAVDACRKYNLPNCKYVQSSFANSNLVEDCNLPSDYFDFVYSRFSYHSIKKSEVPNANNNAKKLLKQNGLLFIETRSTNDPRFNKGTQVDDNSFIDTHFRRFSDIHETISQLENSGFQIISASEEFRNAWYQDDLAVVLRIVAQKV